MAKAKAVEFGLLILRYDILVRLDKIYIIGRTFTTYYSSLIEVESYLDTIIETIVNILVFAHGLHFLNDLNSV